MDKKKYQQLKEVIQKSNPEIMELKHGCKVIYADEMSEPGEVLLGMYEMNFEKTKVFNPYNKDDSGNLIEILGRPIRLADVLIVLEPSDNWKKDELLELWNLKDNNLDNQSDECKEFLIKLLLK